MNKKLLSLILGVFMLIAVSPTAVFAKKTATDEINEAIKAVRTNASEILVFNDMTMEEFLGAAAKVLPEDNTCTLSFEKESDYRISNATTQRAGSIFANILFTSSYETTYPVSRHEMYDFKIAQLTGDSAVVNADAEKVEADKKAVTKYLQTVTVTNETTKEKLLKGIQSAATNGSTVAWGDDFEKREATEQWGGSIKGTINLTLNSQRGTVTVNKRIKNILPGKEQVENIPILENNETYESVGFTDVDANEYYANAVSWAVTKNITTGTSTTTFSPDNTCTRAQIITFLWRAVGSPKATSNNPFTDVKETDYFYDAAVWASEKGMVTGNAFEGNTPCTRSSTVVYLWKNAGSPEAKTTSSFTDVSASSEYAQAVAWAVNNSITSGTSDTTFSPDMTCTRGQIATFLFRAIK